MALFSDAAPRAGSPIFVLAPGEVYIPPAGWYNSYPGLANTQRYDARASIWRQAGDPGNNMDTTYYDGQTIRIANTTGCAIAAIVTTAGSGYTTAPTVTPSAGGSVWTAVVGGALSTTVVINTPGAGYVYPPLVLIEQPPAPGVMALATATISNGTVSAITVTSQGAGYLYPPNVAIVNDSRDTSGYGAQATASLTGAGTITAVLCNNHGNPIVSGTVPTLAFSSGSAAATVLMDWVITSVSITAAGAGYTSAAANVTALGAGGYTAAAPAYVGTSVTTDLIKYRPATVAITTNASGGLASAVVADGGRYLSVPTPAIVGAQTYTTVGTLTFTMGGTNTNVLLWPSQQ